MLFQLYFLLQFISFELFETFEGCVAGEAEKDLLREAVEEEVREGRVTEDWRSRRSLQELIWVSLISLR